MSVAELLLRNTTGLGSSCPDPRADRVLDGDGLVVPLGTTSCILSCFALVDVSQHHDLPSCNPGSLVPSGVQGCSLLYNEFIVYDLDKVSLSHLFVVVCLSSSPCPFAKTGETPISGQGAIGVKCFVGIN